ncbi:hypothetical protein M9Y10_031043 [Tritrichomonas musculus]|uniref:Surface antigen BspA-like n=1 Tax=Tritrichomonas musculus TaxID=1915356 RepID=A0ABR2H2H1_9EUKA
MRKQTKPKRDEQEFDPQEPKYIECIHNKTLHISEKDLNNIKILKKYFFFNMKSDYIYSISFSKDSKLEYINTGAFSNLNLYSITFPPSLKILMTNSLKGCDFLNQIIFLKNDSDQNFFNFLCDKALANTQIESIILPEQIKEIGSYCFPKCLKQIEFDNGAPNLERVGSYAFSQTQIESFKMPLNIDPFVKAKNVFYMCKNLDTIYFDCYTSNAEMIHSDYEDNLEERKLNKKIKFKESIQKVTPNSKSEKIEVSQDFARSLLFSQLNIKKIEILSSNLNLFYFYNTKNLTSISIPKSDNASFIKFSGCIYTKDKEKLIVAERNITSASILAKCKFITNYAFNIKSFEKVLFKKNSELQEISFLAFSESKIKNINIPNSVDLIDYGAFYKCKKLESLNVPRSLFMIDFFTFSFTKLMNILIPNNVIKIGYGCFFKCTNLKNVMFEKNSKLVEIDDFAFACTKIESISIPKSVQRIGDYCFYNCNRLKSIKFADNSDIEYFGWQCFNGTKIDFTFLAPFTKMKRKTDFLETIANFLNLNFLMNITEIVLPSTTEIITARAFANCTNLAKVELIDIAKSRLKTIAKDAFLNCTSLSDFKIPKTAKEFGKNCFKNCSQFIAMIRVVSNDRIYIGKNAFENSGIKSFISKSGIIKIDDFAFQKCDKLIKFKANATTSCVIGNFAFYNCSFLEEVEIAKNAEHVSFGESCFMNSTIRNFVVPNNLKVIPKNCFKSCQKLKNVQIEEESNVTRFSREAFANSSIKSIFIPSKTEIVDISCFEKCKKLQKVTFSSNLIACSLKEKAFYMSGLKELVISHAINKINFACFEMCKELINVSFDEETKLKKIEKNVFKSTGIESIVFPQSIKKICSSSFQSCQKLKSVSFSGKNVAIYPFAFTDCNNLQSVECKPSISLYDSNLNGNYFVKIKQNHINVKAIKAFITNNKPFINDSQFFYSDHYVQINCDEIIDAKFTCHVQNIKGKLIKVPSVQMMNGIYYKNFSQIVFCHSTIQYLKIPKFVTSIGPNAFKNTLLKKVDFEEGSKLVSIGSSSFENSQIEEIAIPDSVEYIQDFAFYNCNNLKKVHIQSKSNLLGIHMNAFAKTSIKSIVFPSTLKFVSFHAFQDCPQLTTVKNYSKDIAFDERSFLNSNIENIEFSPTTYFNVSSFCKSKNLKKITFIEKPEKVTFREDSFAFTGIESINLDCDVDISNNAFYCCENLKQVILTGDRIKCSRNSFYHSKIEELTLKLILNSWLKESNEFIHHVIKDSILITYIEKLSLDLSYFSDKKQTKQERIKISLENKCFVVDGNLFYADMIDNKSLFVNYQEEEVKKNEILKVPNYVKKLSFPVMSHIKKIQWPDDCTIDILGPPGFFSYYNLVEIMIPKSVQVIGPHLFEHCHFLSTVQFEEGSNLKKIGEFAFSNTRIEEIEIPDTVKVIEQSTFANDIKLKKVIFTGEIIGKEAFLQTGMTEFNLSNNIRVIESNAFQFCRSLRTFNIDIENSCLSEIGPYAFSETAITEISIPQNIKIIKKFTFNGCQHLKEVVISGKSNLESIEKYSFSGNIALEKINIPKTINKLSYNAFINTPSLISIMNESNKHFIVNDDNCVYSKDNSLRFVPRNLSEYKIKEKCLVIHSGAFCGPNLESVAFSDSSLVRIEKCAFAHSVRLKKIVIPSSVQKIGNEAFIDCQNLETVEFMPSCLIKEIPKYCFTNSGLKIINLPSSVEVIRKGSFYLCKDLTNINLFDTKVEYIDDFAFSGTNIEELKFPSSIKFIGSHAFEGIKSLKEVDFSQFKYISNFFILNKFYISSEYKTNIKEVMSNNLDMQNLVVIIHTTSFSNASVKLFKFDVDGYRWFSFFNNCTKIEEIIVNPNIHLFLEKLRKEKYVTKRLFKTNEVNGIFGNLYKVKKLIWNHQDTIQFYQSRFDNQSIKVNPLHFLNTSKLIKIYLGEETRISNIPECCFSFTWLKEIYIPSSVLVIKSSAFKYCNNLEKVTFAENSQLITIENFAFYGCKKLKAISIPNKIKCIPESCFSFTGLTEIILPSSIEVINSMAFYNCKNLSQIVFNEGLIVIGDSAFANNESIIRIDLPDSLIAIQPHAFLNCINLKQVNTTKKTNLVEIHNGSFENTQIEELKLSPSLINLFEPFNVPKLNKITFYDGILLNFLPFEDGTLYEIDKDSANYYESFDKCNLTHLLQSINNFDLKSSSTRELELLASKISMFSHKLYKLVFIPKNLEYLKIQDCCSKIGNSVLDGINSLQTIEYVKGKSNIINDFPNCCHLYKGAFNSIKNIKILGNYSLMQPKVFSYNESLEKVEFGHSTCIYIIPKFAFLSCRKLQEIIIPSSCILIEQGAFKDCISLNTVKFGSSQNNSKSKLQVIEKEAFYNCSSLTNIDLPSSVTTICEGAFMKCIKLKSFAFERKSNQGNLEKIEENAFRNCSSLESFIVPQSCQFIGHSAFMDCTNMRSFEFKRSRIECIHFRTFCNCVSLESFELQITKDEVKTENNKSHFYIGSESFMNCTSLKEITIYVESNDGFFNVEKIPYKTLKRETIQEKAFCDCKSLTKVHIFVDDFQKIGKFAFLNCSLLRIIEFKVKCSSEYFYYDLDKTMFVGAPKDLKIKLSDQQNNLISEISIPNFE